MRPFALSAAIIVAMPLSPQAQPKPVPNPLASASVAVSQAAARISPRPLLRPDAVAVDPERGAAIPASLGSAGFGEWLDGFRVRARRAGISERVLDSALSRARYQPDIVALDRNQAEFGKTLWEYLDGAVSPARIAAGQAALRRHAQVLDAIERRHGVEKEVVVAVWGMESAYGKVRGSTDVIAALATLAYDGRRGDFFEGELIAALQILQAGETTPGALVGSWAGAMGHTQFMPSSYLDHAVDGNGDGRRDIWSDDPADALASTANYLAGNGWQKGLPWALEVTLPTGFDYALSGKGTRKSVDAWARLGVIAASGAPLRGSARASILVPAGARGPALMIFANYDAIRAYNSATSYVIGVGLLSDRLKGQPGFRADWPRGDRPLRTTEKRELQQRLTARGFSTQGIDGKIGPDTIAAIQRYQKSAGLVADGYATVALLERLR